MAGGYNLGTAEGLIRIRYDGSGASQAQQGFQQTEQSARRSSETFDRTGRTLGIAGAGIAAGIAFATKAAIDFEKEISAIAAVSGATKPELDALRQKALQLGADTSFSASQAALAMEELAKAGISTADILGGAADATVALAAAGGVELPAAATIAANAMNAFSLSAKDLPQVADLIAGAANASAIDVSDFGQSLQQAGAVAHLAGVPFADLSVAIAEMGNAGIKGSDAGTSLKTFLQNLIPVTKEQTTLSQQLGLITKDGANAFFDASGKVKSLADVSQILQGALKGMGKEQQLATLQTLFGSDAIRAAAILADNGSAGFNKLSESMGKVKAADVAAERLNNAAGKLEALKGSVETAAISIGSLLLPQLTKIAKATADFFNWLNSLSPGMQSLIVDGALAAAGVLLLAAGIAKVIATATVLNGALTIIKAWSIWSRLAAIASNAWALATWALDAAWAASPIGVIIAAIVLVMIALGVVIFLIWTHSAAFRDFFIGVWSAIWGFLKTIGAWFAGPFANFFIGVWAVLVGVFNNVRNAVMTVVSFIISLVVAYFNIWKAIFNFFAPVIFAVFNLIVAIIKTAWAIISAIFAVAATLFDATVGTALRALWSLVVLVFNAWVTVISAVMSSIWGVLTTVWGIIFGFLSAIWTSIVGVATAAWNAVANVIRAVFNSILGVVLPLASLLASFLSGVWNGIRSVTSAVWNSIVGVITNVWNAIFATVRNAVQTVATIINGISVIVGKVGQFFNQLKEAAQGGTGSLIAFVGQIPGKILGALGNVGTMLYESGVKIIQGLIEGITNMAGRVGDAVGGVLSKARNLLPFSPAKEGPFSGKGWTLYSGQSMVEALAAGIIRSGDSVQSALASVLGDTSTTLGLAFGATSMPGDGSALFGLVSGSSSQTSIGGTVTIDARSTVNVPAAITDPDQIARFAANRISTALATSTSTSGMGR